MLRVASSSAMHFAKQGENILMTATGGAATMEKVFMTPQKEIKDVSRSQLLTADQTNVKPFEIDAPESSQMASTIVGEFNITRSVQNETGN